MIWFFQRIFLLSFLSTCLVLSLAAQERFFYTGQKPGSEMVYNPVNLILNGSYDILQLEGQSKKIGSYPYSYASKEVFANLRNPFASIRDYGTWNFISNEVIPFNFTRRKAQWWPNYNLHLIGGGMTYVATAEWYDIHGFPYPRVLSFGTMTAYHLLNEVVENGYFTGTNVDPISDIYIFDLGGIILFSFDGVARFFSHDLNLADWSRQASFSVVDGTLRNNGQYFSIKWRFPSSERWHLFYYFGMDGLGGASYKLDEKRCLSAGVGMRSRKRTAVYEGRNQQTVELVWNMGVFYDTENSLLASVVFSGMMSEAIAINIYPGVVRIGSFSPGLWCTMDREGKPAVGITTQWIPGLAVTKN